MEGWCLERRREWGSSSAGLPVSQFCSAGVFLVDACWCWRLGWWDEMGEERFREKVLVNQWGWVWQEKEQSRFSTTEQRSRPGKLEQEEQKQRCGFAFSLLVSLSIGLAKGTCLGWKQGTKKYMCEEGGWKGSAHRGAGKVPRCSAEELGMRLGDWIWANRRRKICR